MPNLPSKTNSNPIGIFDSGIGGLTVASAIHKAMPSESIIYFGDTAHLPYGDKSPDSIKYYSIRIADFLLEKNAKVIVIACNTASAIAFEAVKRHVGKRALVVGVIEPTVEFISKKFHKGEIGVIGTKGTIKSDVYAKKLKEKNRSLIVNSISTPLLAPMIEEGFFNNKISRTIINSYLSKSKLKKIKALILACTHYPLIKPEILEYYNKKVEVIDSAETVANYIKDLLGEKKLLSSSKAFALKFFISDYTKAFEKSTRIFFSGKLKLEHFPIWENE